MGVHPFAYVIPEVLASNIGGAATLIGDPPSTIVGSHLGMGFTEYMVNMAPIAIICMLVLLVLVSALYWREYRGARKRLSTKLAVAQRLWRGAFSGAKAWIAALLPRGRATGPTPTSAAQDRSTSTGDDMIGPFDRPGPGSAKGSGRQPFSGIGGNK